MRRKNREDFLFGYSMLTGRQLSSNSNRRNLFVIHIGKDFRVGTGNILRVLDSTVFTIPLAASPVKIRLERTGSVCQEFEIKYFGKKFITVRSMEEYRCFNVCFNVWVVGVINERNSVLQQSSNLRDRQESSMRALSRRLINSFVYIPCHWWGASLNANWFWFGDQCNIAQCSCHIDLSFLPSQLHIDY